jgi:hypothetical protein
MTSGVVTVGRHRYAVGLYWENSPGKGRVAQIAKEAAAQPGQQADFYAVRPGNPKTSQVPQFGLCGSEAGQIAGMPTLAGCLAAQVPGSWAGAFRLNEGIAVTVVRDDLVVPDGDLFFTDETEARNRLIQEIGFGGLQMTYAPEAWSIPGADTIPLSLVLNERRDVTLRAVTVPQKVKFVIGGLALGLVIIVGVVWYWQTKLDEENAANLIKQQELLRAQQAAQALLPHVLQQPKVPEPTYERQWEHAPPPLEVIESCRQGLAQIPVALAGWRLSSLKCNGSTINYAWARDKGIAAPPEGAVLNDTLTTATQVVTLPHLAARGAEILGDPDVMTKRYLLQNRSLGLAKTADDPPPPPPQGYTGTWNPPPPPWIKRSFTFSVPELPSDVPELISGLPGVVINAMNYAPSGTFGTWSIEGVIYENRK